MNEFTKEELKCIYASTAQHALEGWVNVSPELIQKIQLMIDGYCDHNRPYTKLGITVCLDCQEVIKNLEI